MEAEVINYLRNLDIPVSRTYCKRLIASHPDYPSLLSITDTLQRLGINHNAVRMGKDEVRGIAFPYLLKPDHEGAWFSLIKDQQDLAAVNQPDNEYTHAIALQAEPTGTITNEENNKQRSQETFSKNNVGILLAAIAGLVLLSLTQLLSWIYVALLVTVIAGAIVGYLLIAKELGTTYEAVETFCKSGKKTNCDAVLQSDAAQLIGNITLSDVAATYFIFQLIVVGLLIPLAQEVSFLWGLSILSACTIPVIGYSMYYQWKKVQTWCRLCLAVAGVLVLQAALFAVMYATGMLQINSVNLLVSAYAIILFVAVGASLLFIKNERVEARRSTEREASANRIKYAPSVFMHVLSQQERVDTTPFKQEPIIGKPDAPLKLLMAGSLGCGPCKEGFEKSAELVDAYPQKVHVRVRFVTNEAQNGQVTPGQYLLNYWQQKIQGNEEESIRTKELYKAWYNYMDLDLFKKQFPIAWNEENIQVEGLEDRWGKWFKQVDIDRTPTFFLNGYRLPKGYRIGELMGLVVDVSDHFRKAERLMKQDFTKVVR